MPDAIQEPVTRAQSDADEWKARVDLAAAYRLTHLLGWSDFLGTHLSCRVPGRHDQFLINPYGMLFEEVTASSLIKVDMDGNKLSASPYGVNQAGFTIHSAIHMGVPSAFGVMHCHTPCGVAVSAHKDGLLPITQMALTVMSLVRYHDYEGVALDLSERERLLRDMGDGGVMLLRNHGTLSIGTTIPEMFGRMQRLERACKFQVYALMGGNAINPVADEVIAHTTRQGREMHNISGPSNRSNHDLLWDALVRKLDRENPGYDA